MGKKRSNRNKRKKNCKNVLQNPSEGKKLDSVLDQNVKKEKAMSTDSHDIESNKLCGKICSPSLNQAEGENQDSASFQKYQTRPMICCSSRTAELDPADIFPIGHYLQNVCLSESDEENPALSISDKKSFVDKRVKQNFHFQNCIKELNDELTFSRYLSDKSSESDDEYSTSDFLKPAFDDWYEEKNKMPLEKNLYGVYEESSLCAENTFSEASCSSFRYSTEKFAFEDEKFKENVSGTVNAYKSSKDYFSDVYHTWVPERRNTLQKLRTLHSEVCNDQLNYNKSQEAFRTLGYMSRSAKTPNNQVVNFLASFTAFLGDAASGMISVAQAFNVDSYQSKFKEIMEHDAEFTKRLYASRSQCVAKYQDIEEVMRKFHSDNFSSTIGKISNVLEVDKYWESMKNAYKNDDMAQLLEVVSKFFDNALQSTKLEEVSDSIHRYADDNPAAVEACKSAGRATYEAIDTWVGNRVQNHVYKGVDMAANNLLIIDDRREIERLRNSIEGDSPQSKIESQIEDAIDSLESELSDMKRIFLKLFKYHDGSSCNMYESYY